MCNLPTRPGLVAGRRIRTQLGAVRRMCVLAVAVALVTGCVGMPSNGPAQQLRASPASSEQDGNLIGSVPLGPQSGESPADIVQGFLTAADSYPLYGVALEYLTSSAVKLWKPGFAVTVFSTFNGPDPVTAPTPKASPTRSPQASVEVSGTVQSKFNGSGQYVSAQNQVPASTLTSVVFNLVKVNGQWRIVNPPDYRMLLVSDFPFFYKAQDLYFMDPQDQVLVPDSVFVPLGATVAQLLTDLVDSLAASPKTPWLVNATDTELQPHVNVGQVFSDASTVTVNLTFPRTVQLDTKQLALFAAQLVWTLIGPPSNPSSGNISSVVLELNGHPWTPSSSPCPDGRIPGQAQNLLPYQCFDPYPSSPSSFYYVEHGQAWTRCGAQFLGLAGSVGSVMPIVGHTGAFATPQCSARQSVKPGDTTAHPVQPSSLPAVTMASLSRDGTYLAVVTAANGDLYIGKPSGPAASFASMPRLSGGDITSLSWDRNDNLWVTQGGQVYMLPPTGKVSYQVNFSEFVTDLAVAPDGVRLAFIARGQASGSPAKLYLAAIGGGPPASGQLGSSVSHLAINAAATIGPGLSRPASVAWYDADDLVVVNDVSGGNTLMEVPVDGQQPQQQIAPQGLSSITAGGHANVLVAGVSGGNLSISTSLEGPWSPLGDPGAYPAYPG